MRAGRTGHVQIVAFRKLEIEFSKLKLFFFAQNCVLALFFTEIGFLVQTIYQIILYGTKLFKSQLFSNYFSCSSEMELSERVLFFFFLFQLKTKVERTKNVPRVFEKQPFFTGSTCWSGQEPPKKKC